MSNKYNSRIEYLQALNKMRNNYQSQGNVSVNSEDDSTNVGNELSSFAYMNTAIPSPEQSSTSETSEVQESERNGWQRTVDTVTSFGSNITEGVTNFLDDVFDFTMVSASWVSGFFGGVANLFQGKDFGEGFENASSWAQDAVQYEWEPYLNNTFRQLNVFNNVASGDVFSEDYWNNWANLGSKEQTQEVHKNSWANEWGEVGQNIQNIEQGVGYVLPSIVLAYFTGGASLPAQVGIQAGVAGGTALGSGFEKATQEGADYGHALAYGATKGAISAGSTAITMGIGGNVASKLGSGVTGKIGATVGQKIFNATGSKTAEVFASKAVEIAIKSGSSYVQSFATQLAEPYVASIYDNGNAIAEAYGDDEKVKQYLERCSTNATTSALTTALISAGREGIDFARRGSNGYMAKYYLEKANMAQNYVQKELGKIANDVKTGKISTKEQLKTRLSKLDRYNATVERYGSEALDYAQKAFDKATTLKTKDGQTIVSKGNLKTKEDLGANKDIFEGVVNLSKSKTSTDNFYSFAQKFVNSKDNVSTSSTSKNKGYITYTDENDGQSYNLPITVNDDGSAEVVLEKSDSVSDAVIVLGTSTNKNLPRNIEVEAKNLNIPQVQNINSNTRFYISKNLTQKIVSGSQKNEVIDFLDKNALIKSKDSFVFRANKNELTVATPFEEKYGLITINPSTNEITNIEVGKSVPSFATKNIVAKRNITKLKNTKLLNEDGTALVFDSRQSDYDWDLGNDPTSLPPNLKPSSRENPNGVFVYSKKPLKMSEFSKELPFSKIAKTLNIPSSLEKTYNLKLNNANNELSVLTWLSKRSKMSVQQILDKLGGYDSIVKKDGSVTTFNYGNIIDRGVKYKYGRGSEDYSSIIGRNVSNNTIQELQGYIGENGRKFETFQDQKRYATLVRETFAYHEVDIEHNGEVFKNVKIIDNEVYTPQMKEITSLYKKIGVKVRFGLRLLDDYHSQLNVAGYFTNKDGATIFIDSAGFGGFNGEKQAINYLNEVSLHELGHAIFEKLHGKTILSELKGLSEYTNKEEWNELVNKYQNIVDYSEEEAYDEILANVFAGSQELSDKDWVKEFREKTWEVYNDGTRKSNYDYYKLLGEQEASDYDLANEYDSVAVDEIPTNNNAKNNNKKEFSISIAPYRSLDISNGVYKEARNAVENTYFNHLSRFAELVGVKTTFTRSINGLESNSGLHVGEQVNQIGYEFNVKTKDFDKAYLFTCLATDLGHETQETGLLANYVSSDDTSANGIEYRIKTKKNSVSKIISLLKSCNIKNYNYQDENGILKITTTQSENLNELKEQIDTLVKKGKKEGLIYGKGQENCGRAKINYRYVTASDRRSFYEEWLRNRGNSGRGVLIHYVKQALRRAEAEVEIAPYKEQLNNLLKTNFSNVDFSKIEHENVNGKVAIKEDDNSKPLFETARLVNKITSIEKPFAIEFLKSSAKRFGFSVDEASLNFLQKSVSSIADRIYRNKKNGKSVNVYSLHDLLRTYLVVDEKSLKNVKNFMDYLAPFLINPEFDLADTDFGYKGVHIQGRFQDIPLEIQLHTKESWEVKTQQDKIYEKWRSKGKTVLTDDEVLEKYNDIEKSKEISSHRGDDFENLFKIATEFNEDYNNLNNKLVANSQVNANLEHSSSSLQSSKSKLKSFTFEEINLAKIKKNVAIDSIDTKNSEFDGSKLNVAITATEDIDLDTYDRKITVVKEKMQTFTNNLTKLTGIKMKVGEAIGGYLFDDGTDVGGEPSVPTFFGKDVSDKDVAFIGSLIGTSAYEYQESVGTVKYDDSGEQYEDTFLLNKVDDGVKQAIINAGLKYYTLNVKEKTLVITDGDNAIIDKTLGELVKGGYLNVEERRQQKCSVNWLGADERANICKVWLQENSNNPQNRELRSLVKKCYEVDKFVSNHKLEVFGDYKKGIKPIYDRNFDKLYQVAHKYHLEQKQLKQASRYNDTEIVKNTGSLKHARVYGIKDTNELINNSLQILLDNIHNAKKITIPTGKTNLKNFTFEELNLAKNVDKAVDNIVEKINSAVVTLDNGVNGTVKLNLSDFNIKDEIKTNLKNLLANSGQLSEKSKWVKKYMDTLNKYANYVHRRALLTSEYITAIKAQNTLTKAFDDTRKIRIGGENIVQEITLYKNMVKGFLITKGRKNVAPSAFTNLVNNFVDYTPENYNEFYDQTLKGLVDSLKESFENGKFPQREPTLEEMQLFNTIRGRVLTRVRELSSEKHLAKIKMAENGVKDASVVLPSVKPKTYGIIKSALDSDIAMPIYLSRWLGKDHPLVQHLSTEYFKVSSNEALTKNKFEDFVTEKLSEKAGYKKYGALIKDLNKKVSYQIVDRNGRSHKFTINDIVGAYWTYNTNKEELLATGLTMYDSKSKTDIDYKLTEEDYQKMFKEMPAQVKAWADLVYKEYFNGMDFEYKKGVIEKYFGISNFLDDKKGSYAPTFRVGQVNTGLGATSQFEAGYLSTMLQGFLKKRVKNKNHFRWFSGTNLLDQNMSKVASWGEKSQWIEDLRVMLNTTVPSVGNHTLEYYLEKNVPEWKSVWSPYMTKIALGKNIVDQKSSIIEKIGNAGQVATLGFNFLGSVPKQFLSDFSWALDERVTWGMWLKSIPQAINNFFRMGSIKKELMENNGYFINRFNKGDVLKAIMNGKLPNKIAQMVLKPMEWVDSMVVTTHGYALAQRIVNQGISDGTYDFKRGSIEYRKEVANILQQLVILTQSNSDPMFMSRLRSGDISTIARDTMGRFHSDSQNKYQGLRFITDEKIASENRIKAYNEQAKKAETEEEKNYWKGKAEQEAVHFKKDFGKKIASLLAVLLLNGLGATAISTLKNKILGKEEWDDFNAEELLKDTVLESTVNWLPYVGTIANAIENNSDVSSFTVEKINNLVDTAKLVITAFESGKENDIKRAIVNLIKNGLELTGVPAENMYQLFMGIWYQIDKEGSLTAQNWVKGYSSSYMKTQYSTYVKEGNFSKARAQLGAWSSMYGTNNVDANTLDEVVRLAEAGYSVSLPSISSTYTDENGETQSFSKSQISISKSALALADTQVANVISSEAYQSLDDEYKSKVIAKVYSVYKEYAKASALNVAPSSKLGQMLYYTNGNVDLAKYVLYIQNLSSISADNKNTRKQKVVNEINKIKGLSRQEKLLLAYLCGYSVSDTNTISVKSYLMKIGFTAKEAKEFLE